MLSLLTQGNPLINRQRHTVGVTGLDERYVHKAADLSI